MCTISKNRNRQLEYLPLITAQSTHNVRFELSPINLLVIKSILCLVYSWNNLPCTIGYYDHDELVPDWNLYCRYFWLFNDSSKKLAFWWAWPMYGIFTLLSYFSTQTRWSCYRVKLEQRENCEEFQLSGVLKFRIVVFEITDGTL